MLCSYCGRAAVLVTGREIYPHRSDLYAKQFWSCRDCDAYVGCHRGTTRPLGRLANAELRQAKMRAHRAFDRLWQSGRTSRSRAYRLLAERLELTVDDCHIGMFDLATCERVLVVTKEISRQLQEENQNG